MKPEVRSVRFSSKSLGMVYKSVSLSKWGAIFLSYIKSFLSLLRKRVNCARHEKTKKKTCERRYFFSGSVFGPSFRGHHIMQVEKKNTLKNWPANSLALTDTQI